MAGNNNQSSVKYFRSSIPGLSTIVGEPQDGQVAPETVRFVPYQYISDIGEVFVHGYLKTDDSRAIEKFEADANVTEIDQEAYEKYTDTSNEKVKRASL